MGSLMPISIRFVVTLIVLILGFELHDIFKNYSTVYEFFNGRLWSACFEIFRLVLSFALLIGIFKRQKWVWYAIRYSTLFLATWAIGWGIYLAIVFKSNTSFAVSLGLMAMFAIPGYLVFFAIGRPSVLEYFGIIRKKNV